MFAVEVHNLRKEFFRRDATRSGLRRKRRRVPALEGVSFTIERGECVAVALQPGIAEFRYVAGTTFRKSALDRIRQRIHEKLGDDFQITFRDVKEVEKTPRGKHRWLVSKLPQARLNV